MSTPTIAEDHHRASKTFIACLIISLMVLSPLAPLASAGPRFTKRVEAAPATPPTTPPEPAAPFVPSITATKTDSFPDVDGNGKAEPGDTITYDVNITNNGDDATGVNFQDTIDANTTLVGGSLKVSPLAFADVYAAAKDVPLVVGTPGVLTNDTGLPAPTAVPIAGGATAQGGTVTLNANGSFTYNPPAGFEGSDSFTYTVTNGLTPNDTALVVLNVDAPPSVTSTTPTNSATDQAVNTDITITFSEPVNVTGDWFQISCTSSPTRNPADTVVTPSGGNTVFTINPNSDFATSETCTVTVFAAQVTDQDASDPPDNMAANFVFSFTMSAVSETAPTVTTTTPTNGATQVAVNSNITINFSENVNIQDATAFTLECPVATPIAFTVTPVAPGGTNSFTLDPNADLPLATICTVTVVASKVTDVDANDPPDNMAADFVFTFTTDAAPSVTTTTPTNGATQVATNTNITINFSENVNIQDATAFTLECPVATPIAFAVTPVAPGGTNSFTLDPTSDLPVGTICTVTVVASKVTDVDAGDPPDNMAANFVFTFTTDQPPSVTSTVPTNGAVNQATNTDITINFSEAVNVTGDWFQISCPTTGNRNPADTVVTPSGGNTVFTINPNSDFAANETCTVTVFAANVTDQDSGDPPDNMAANFVFSFTAVDAAPTVTTTTPTNGATQVAVNSNITINFSENVNIQDSTAFTLECPVATPKTFTVIPAAPGGTNSFTLDPTSDLPAGTICTVTVVASKVTDVDAVDPPDNMAANFVFSFTTDAAPSVTTTTPTNGATQVATNTNITINFSENVNIQDATAFTLECPVATPKTFAVTPVAPGGTNSFTLDPTSDLPTGTICTVTVVASKVTDVDAVDPPDNMVSNFVFSFTTDAPPSVTSTVPTNGATGQAINTNVTINFSEAVNVTGNWFQIACPNSGTRIPSDTVVTPNGGSTSFVINPNNDFGLGETCTVTVFAANVTDQDSGDPPDNMAANFIFSFTTVDAAPTVTTTTPTNGATQVAVNSNITINFSENVNIQDSTAFTLECPVATPKTFTVIPAAPGGTNSFTLDPTSDLPVGTICTVTVVASKVTDVDTVDPPDAMAANFVFSFTTDAPPSVTTTTPTNGATQVASNTNITINFSENVNIQDSTAFTLECPVATPIAFSVIPTAPGGTNSFTLDPTSDLPLATICTVTVVASKVTDVDAGDPPDNMAANFVFSFTTDQAPSVTTTVPTNNATDVALNSTITINFSENVNVASGGVTIDCGGAVNFTPALPQNNLTSLVLTPTGGLPAGSTCTVTVDKTKISDTDAGDPPDNMVNDFVFSFKVKPDAINDTYPGTLIGNVGVNSANAPYTITGNDVSANAFSITAVQAVTTVVANTISATSTNGGSIVMIVSGVDRGKFTYNPPAGFEGTDTFTYTISRDDGGGTDTATVSMPISGMIWFINNNAASCVVAGCGRLSNPFSTLAAFNSVNNGTGNNPATNDNIFVFESATDYVGPVTLLNGQKFIGQDATASLDSITGLTPPAGSNPLPLMNSGNGTITNITSAGIGITVGQNNTLRGFTGGNAVPDITGNGFGTLNISDVTLNGNGQALNLTNGTLAATFGSISSTNSATTGISLTTVAGSLTSGSTTITNPTGIGISVNTSSGALNFGNTTANQSGNTGVSLTTNTGAITFGSLNINPDAGQRGLLATDNTQTITTTSGAISTTTGIAVEITRASSTTPLAVALTSVASSGAANGILLRNTSGSFTVNGDGANTSVGGNFTGGTMAGSVGANGAIAGNGVYLENAANVTLRRIRINGTNQNNGIRGLNFSNFTLEFSTINGTNGDDGANDESAVQFDNLTGTAAITSCILDGGFEDNLNLVNTSGTLNRLTISGTTFGFNSSAGGNNNITIDAQGASTTLNFTLKSSLIKGSHIDWMNASANSGSTMDAVIGGPLVADGNNFDNLGANAAPVQIPNGNRLVTGSIGNMTLDIRNNTLKGSLGEAIRVRSSAAGALTGTMNARVRNNTIGVAGTANSGSTGGSGIFVFGDGGSDMNVAVTSNSVFQYNQSGIMLQFGDEINNGAVYNATVTQNTVNTPGTLLNNFNGIQLNNGTIAATDDFTSCVDVGGAGVGNNVSNSGKGAAAPNNSDIRLRQRQATTVRLPGYVGPVRDNTDSDVAEVGTYLLGRNTAVTANGNSVATGGGFIGGAACTQPSFAAITPNASTRRDQLARAIERTTTPATKTQAGPIAPQSANPTVVSVKPAVSQTSSHHAKIVKPITNQVNAMQDKTPRRGISVKPRVAPLSGETVSHSIGTLLAGKTVHIQFQVTVNNPYLGGATVSNQGTVSGSNFSDVLTDDPAAGGAADPTTTPVTLTPSASVADAQANEPSSGSVPMLFTVSLSTPAGASGASVHYATADQAPGAGHAVAGTDYTAVPDTVLNFAAGEQFKTVSVDILFDGAGAEPDETFLLNLSNPTNALISDGQAVGTIKQGNASGTFLISELRTSGPGGAGDDFVELYNNSDTPLVVAASDASGGYGLFKMGADCNATPILIGTIPNGTTIPARGHYLFTGSAYSLADYGGTGAAAGNQTLSEDIPSDGNVAIFNTASVANLSSVTRLDAVGFGSNTGGNCDLLREGATLTPLSGSTLEYSFVRDECGKKANPAIFGPCPTGGLVKDTNVNNEDFIFLDTTAAVTVAGQRLGAPGPQKLGSPLLRNSTIAVLLLDSNFGGPAPPNRFRDMTSGPEPTANGTLSVRRRFVNNTGAPVTRLRVRVVDISTISVPGGIADVRAITSSNITVNGITDSGTCAATGTPATTPCQVTVFGTTLEQPPTQAKGGGHNATLTINLGSPLAPGASMNLQFLLGVQQTGSFKFFFNIEALP